MWGDSTLYQELLLLKKSGLIAGMKRNTWTG